MKESIVKDLEPMLRELAEKLGTTSEYLWGVMINQAYIYAITRCWILIALVSMTFGTVWFGVFVYKKINLDDRDKRWPEEVLIPVIIFGSAILIATGVCFVGLPSDIITGFMNPEYWALNKILSKIN